MLAALERSTAPELPNARRWWQIKRRGGRYQLRRRRVSLWRLAGRLVLFGTHVAALYGGTSPRLLLSDSRSSLSARCAAPIARAPLNAFPVAVLHDLDAVGMSFCLADPALEGRVALLCYVSSLGILGVWSQRVALFPGSDEATMQPRRGWHALDAFGQLVAALRRERSPSMPRCDATPAVQVSAMRKRVPGGADDSHERSAWALRRRAAHWNTEVPLAMLGSLLEYARGRPRNKWWPRPAHCDTVGAQQLGLCRRLPHAVFAQRRADGQEIAWASCAWRARIARMTNRCALLLPFVLRCALRSCWSVFCIPVSTGDAHLDRRMVSDSRLAYVRDAPRAAAAPVSIWL